MQLTKREFLKTAVAGAASLALPLAAGRSEDAAKPVEQLKNTDFSWVRGFNYQPGYGDETGGYEDGTGWSIWWDLRTSVIERELTRGKELFPAMNTVRIWLSYNVYLAQPKKFLEDFSKYIRIISKLKLRVMIVVFNAWYSTPNWDGFRKESFSRLTKEQLDKTFKFADDLLDRHGEDPAVYAWDLCNEPDLWITFDAYSPWLKRLYGHIKSRKEKTVLTVSSCVGTAALKEYEPISDVISIHPYFQLAKSNFANEMKEYEEKVKGYQNKLNDMIQIANSVNKPMIATEIGWGDVDDAKRIEKLHVELSSVNDRKIGFMVHALAHSPVADLHRPETGPIVESGYMACVESDGSIRPGHEAVNSYLK
ncbi:hypothetical protein FACS189419_07100 [Planctomycetales bacterium]|nr:hypothetical protein FACS189419_07100 [Planctomycetales bacterium]